MTPKEAEALVALSPERLIVVRHVLYRIVHREEDIRSQDHSDCRLCELSGWSRVDMCQSIPCHLGWLEKVQKIEDVQHKT